MRPNELTEFLREFQLLPLKKELHGRHLFVRKGANALKAKSVLTKLRAHRAQRVPPMTDKKIITAWNGLALAAIARVARFQNSKNLSELFDKHMSYILKTHKSWSNTLSRYSLAGKAVSYTHLTLPTKA